MNIFFTQLIAISRASDVTYTLFIQSSANSQKPTANSLQHEAY